MTNELVPEDLRFVVSHLPKDMVELLKKFPLFVAGGFIRAIIAGETPSDIDVFGYDRATLELIAKDFASGREGRLFSTDNACTVLAPPRLPVQFITRWLYSDSRMLIESFDYTVCQAVVWWSEDRWHSLVTPRFYIDLAARRLVYICPARDEAAGGSLLRAMKYIRRGYNISPESLAFVIARFVSGVKGFSSHPDIELSQILTGLLREVDPLTVIDGLELRDFTGKTPDPVDVLNVSDTQNEKETP